MKTHSLEKRFTEAWDALWDALVDPNDAFCDRDDPNWAPLASSLNSALGSASQTVMPWTEAQLREVRNQCRMLATTNEFAINGHENRVSYIVGTGHTYRAVSKRGMTASGDMLMKVQQIIDQFVRENCWIERQQEIVRRKDRDGEVFLRYFTSSDGLLRVRFVEPDSVATPTHAAHTSGVRLGILADADDVETVRGYFVDGALIDAAEIQHRKANVDVNVRRGLPLFYPVRKNLRRAEKLLRNMSVVAEIQSAIALIRKHRSTTRSGIESFVANQADATLTNNNGDNRMRHLRQHSPGTILDAPQSIDYEFPASQLNASNYVTILQAELRAIASRLVLPEFMLTSDASNANYSSTMIAEGPAMRMFARLQGEQVRDDVVVIERALRTAVHSGNLPCECLECIEIQATAPSLAVRDQLQEAQRYRIEYENGILSPQTWSQRLGLDYDQEQANFALHGEKNAE